MLPFIYNDAQVRLVSFPTLQTLGPPRGAGGISGWVPANSLAFYDFPNDRAYSNGLVLPNSTTGLTVSRASSGYDLAATTLFPANTARRTPAGLLVEASATNIMLQSINPADSTWSLDAYFATASKSATGITAPDATKTAVTMTITRADSGQRAGIRQQQTVAAGTYAQAVYVQAASQADVGKSISFFQIDGGSFGASFHNKTQITLSSNWQRVVSKTNDPMLAGSNSVLVAGYLQAAYGGSSYTGTTTFNVWGGQVEAGATQVGSLIPTTTGPATRDADIISLTLPSGTGHVDLTYSDGSVSTAAASPGAYILSTTPPGLTLRSLRAYT